MSWSNARWFRVRRAEGERYLLRRRTVPAIDLSYGDPRLAAVRAAAGAGSAEKWPEIRGPLAAAQDAEELTFLVEGLRTVPAVERWIGDVVAADPGDPLPLLVSGARQVERAWRARPETVSAEQDALFRDRLAAAEEQLAEVAAREPSWAAPHYFRQISGRGLRIGPDAADARFEETRRRAPGLTAAYREQLRGLSPRRGGSRERMHAFARTSMLAAPEGSPSGELVALAHLEQWRDLGSDPESGYLGSDPVLRDLHEAAARSVYHPDFARRRDWPLSFNAFAMAFALSGDHAAARPLFQTLGDRATETPWRHLDARSPLVPFLAWRARVNR